MGHLFPRPLRGFRDSRPTDTSQDFLDHVGTPNRPDRQSSGHPASDMNLDPRLDPQIFAPSGSYIWQSHNTGYHFHAHSHLRFFLCNWMTQEIPRFPIPEMLLTGWGKMDSAESRYLGKVFATRFEIPDRYQITRFLDFTPEELAETDFGRKRKTMQISEAQTTPGRVRKFSKFCLHSGGLRC